MAQIRHVPQHIAATLVPEEAFDIICTLRSALREFEGVPESVAEFAATLEAAYAPIGDIPGAGIAIGDLTDDEDGGSAVPAA